MEPWKLDPAHDIGLPPGQRLKSVRREAGLVEIITQAIWWTAVRGYLRLFHRLQIVGAENLPKSGPCLLVANHTSHLDALVLASSLRRSLRASVFPIAAGDTFFKTPVLSAFSAAALNALPVWRRSAGRHALDDLRQRLGEEKCVFILFPEGTRSRDGQLAPFKSGIGMMLAAAVVQAIPCRLTGTFEALPPNRTWPRPAPIRLHIAPPLCFEHLPNTRESWDQIARSLEEAVRSA